jgi:hypothetical protein
MNGLSRLRLYEMLAQRGQSFEEATDNGDHEVAGMWYKSWLELKEYLGCHYDEEGVLPPAHW